MSNHHATAEGNVPFTEEEEAAWTAAQAAYVAGAGNRKAAEVRAERNTKLAESDWTQTVDSTVDRAAWATYRQALRDITTASGFPWTINWPTQP